MSRHLKQIILFLFVLVAVAPNLASAEKKTYIPETLKPWEQWVLQGHPERDCPWIGGPFTQKPNSPENWSQSRICAWASPLELTVTAKGGQFSQRWTLYGKTTIALPGDQMQWPVQVTVNKKPVPVTRAIGSPGILLEAGEYEVEGKFEWNALPKWLALPSTMALVNLVLDGKKVTFPEYNGNRLALGSKRETSDQSAPESLRVKVFRKITDAIPLMVETRILLDVSGPGREVLLGKALLEGHIPMNVNSPIPARLEPDGRLRLQVKPGQWMLNLKSRAHGAVSNIGLPPAEGPWADFEIWSFQADTSLRLTELSGLQTVDPKQSAVPNEWMNLPSFQALPGKQLVLHEKRRGNAEPASDSLKINREIWMDFNGEGYTVRDTITGSMSKGWRLNADSGSQLGRVSIAGEDQLITYSPDGKSAGVEIRQGAINLSAVSRIENVGGVFNSVGWQHDVDSLRATVYLPPGYKVFTAQGVDKASATWKTRWSLFDFFILLIISASIYRLCGLPWGVLALVTIALIFHEPGAPVFVWLNIVASMALLTVLPEGKIRTVTTWYRNGSFLGLIIISFPFMIDEARQGLYPQLESRQYRHSPMSTIAQRAQAPAKRHLADKKSKLRKPADDRNMEMEEKLRAKEPSSLELDSYGSGYNRQFKKVDPDAQIQTGPGLPGWNWNRVGLTWDGPVEKNTVVELYLIRPFMYRVLNFLHILFLAVLAGGLILSSFKGKFKFTLPGASGTVTTGLLFLFLMGMASPNAVLADIPSKQMLDDLRNRLLSPPDCQGSCYDIPRARVDVDRNTLTIRLQVHVKEAIAIPLPGKRQHWLPEHILLDGKAARELSKNTNRSGVWLHVPAGIHQILMKGPLPKTDSVQITFYDKPHKFKINSKYWEVNGVNEGRLMSDSLQLTRILKKVEKEVLRSEAAPPFVQVNRIIRMGLDWQVDTRVTRLAPDHGPINLEVPLLNGESVLTEGIKLKGGRVIVSLGANQRQVRWLSTLEKVDALKLQAADNTYWVEKWVLDTSAIFHVDYEGLPPVVQQRGGQWRPQFRPWPGESLQLNVTRPKGFPGSTLAIDNAQLIMRPGARVTQSELKLTLRSSRGGQHTLTLPENASLDKVLLNGVNQPIRQEGQSVTLPLSPGSQTYGILFKSSQGVGFKTETPQLDLGGEAANVSLNIQVPRSRWLLFVGGPSLGPAILFWGELTVVLLLAVGLGRIPLTPLKTRHWVLLGMAMSTIAVVQFVVVVAWLFALAKREDLETGDYSRVQFNSLQVFLCLFTVVALGCLFSIIPSGLLGFPDMGIIGNGSSSYNLNWYQDRVAGALPTGWFISVPLLVYRIAILLWALWMAFALLKWLRWGWDCLSSGELWRAKIKKPLREGASEKY